MKKISIIVPVYNTSKYLIRCIDSILNQQYDDFEVLIINDGSTDNSEEVLKPYLSNTKIKYYSKENSGIADTRNYGIIKSTGEYVFFVDSDDFISDNLLKNLGQYLNNDIELIKFKMIKVDNNSKEIEKIKGPTFELLNGQEAFNTLIKGDFLIDSPCLYVFKKTLFTDNDLYFLNNTYHEDFGLIPLIILKANTVTSTDIYGYYYLQSNDSITRNNNKDKKIKRIEDCFLHYNNMLETIKKYNVSEDSKQNIKSYYTNSIILRLKELDVKDRKKYINIIKKNKMLKNIKPKNIKQLLKKIIIKVSINLYLKVR